MSQTSTPEQGDQAPAVKRSIAFDFAAEIVTHKTFDELTVKELADVMRARLDRVEAANEKEAFGAYDETEEELEDP